MRFFREGFGALAGHTSTRTVEGRPLATEGDMRFAVLGLLLPVVLGCAGKNVVAGDEKTKSQQLEAAVPSWCETTCTRLQACPARPCECTGDLCDCPAEVGSDCPAQCLKAMA